MEFFFLVRFGKLISFYDCSLRLSAAFSTFITETLATLLSSIFLLATTTYISTFRTRTRSRWCSWRSVFRAHIRSFSDVTAFPQTWKHLSSTNRRTRVWTLFTHFCAARKKREARAIETMILVSRSLTFKLSKQDRFSRVFERSSWICFDDRT